MACLANKINEEKKTKNRKCPLPRNPLIVAGQKKVIIKYTNKILNAYLIAEPVRVLLKVKERKKKKNLLHCLRDRLSCL